MRTFAVVNVASVSPLVNAAGAAVLAAARTSYDGSQVILDFNHSPGVVEALFLPGVDVDQVLAGCQILSQPQALSLVESPEWCNGGDI